MTSFLLCGGMASIWVSHLFLVLQDFDCGRMFRRLTARFFFGLGRRVFFLLPK